MKKEVFYITLRRGTKPSYTQKIVIDGDSYWELFHEIETAIILPDVTSFSVRKPRIQRSGETADKVKNDD